MGSKLFHPAVAAWFYGHFQAPTDCQKLAWPALKNGRHVLIAAPTGSGKTLAAFLASLDDLIRKGEQSPLPDETYVLYVSPLKALSNDIHKNLERPLKEIRRKLAEFGCGDVGVNAFVRSGDTPPACRAAMRRKPPHILVTTPESFYILLGSDSGRGMLKTVRTVIIDEIHAVVAGKRGAHLALSLERLEHLTGGALTRIGLSATQRPLAEVGRFLVGDPENRASCDLIDVGYGRELDMDIVVPASPLEAVLSGQAASEVYDQLARLIEAHTTTLVFVNTRRMAERVARYLSERIGEDNVTSHHGSLAKEQRWSAEARLRAGQLKALVATASLELGIDIGDVDLVCQIGTTRSISTFLQRIGRSGHHRGGIPKGRLFPTSRDELIECIALIHAVRNNELDRLRMPLKPIDVLAQQIVAMVACEDWQEEELFACVRKAYPFQSLTEEEFKATIRMLAKGFSTQKGQRGAHLYRDAINKRVKARRGARLTALTCGGAIPDNADYRVILEPSGEFLGTVDEDFAMESLSGDIFQLGNNSWRFLRLESGELKVEDARNLPPSIPFWFGEAPGRTQELSAAVSDIREQLASRCASEADSRSACQWLHEETGITGGAAQQAVNYISAAKTTLGVIPSLRNLVLERFFDESGGTHVVIHAPFGNRVNRGWGLALRKCFCRKFNFELQAAATENAILFSMGTSHSFPLAEVGRYLHSHSVEDILVQALLDAPMFKIRWRWNASCALAIRRFQNGKKTPPYLLRMQAEDLIASAFPEQMACLDNIAGDREIPDHPLVRQTITDCLTEAMDIDRLIGVLQKIESGEITIIAKDVVEPSPLAAEILTARNYAFLDDTPAEERRSRAVHSRRWLDPMEASDLGKLDVTAIERVKHEAWPEIESPDELCDALTTIGFIAEDEIEDTWVPYFKILTESHRATRFTPAGPKQKPGIAATKTTLFWISAERLPEFQALYPNAQYHPLLTLPSELGQTEWAQGDALTEIIKCRLSACGPVQAVNLVNILNLDQAAIEQSLLALENTGDVLRGRFNPGAQHEEWCERRLLARIHRYTLKSLRKQIEPVSTSAFIRFLFQWQRLDPDHRAEGPEALPAIIGQLEGFESAASAWESEIFCRRFNGYETNWLDNLCRSGKIAWARLTPAQSSVGPVRSSPLAFFARRNLRIWQKSQSSPLPVGLTGASEKVVESLLERGAQFFDELQDHCHLLKTHLEEALAQLVATGLVSCDSFLGLRAILLPEQKKRARIKPLISVEDAGRWALLRSPHPENSPAQQSSTLNLEERKNCLEHIARVLLNRYGVVFRALLTRESLAPNWGELLPIYRRMEDRGEIRGGRFVGGQYGEQFALKEAVESLRKKREHFDDLTFMAVSACDPINLLGIITPGTKLTAHEGNRILFQGGVPIASQTGKDIRHLQKISEEKAWEIKQHLIRNFNRSGVFSPTNTDEKIGLVS